jgi:hypothetical protein
MAEGDTTFYFHKPAKKCWLLVDSAGVGIIGHAHRNRNSTGLSNRYFGRRGSGDDLGGGSSAGQGKDNNECANEIFHESELLDIKSEFEILELV